MRPPPLATCHPDRLHLAKGLCRTCYNKQRNWNGRLDLATYNRLNANQKNRCILCHEIRTLLVHFVDSRPEWLWCRRCRGLTKQLEWLLRRYHGDWDTLRRMAERLGGQERQERHTETSGYDPDDA